MKHQLFYPFIPKPLNELHVCGKRNYPIPIQGSFDVVVTLEDILMYIIIICCCTPFGDVFTSLREALIMFIPLLKLLCHLYHQALSLKLLMQ